jgi:quinol monooxygenase YgiN
LHASRSQKQAQTAQGCFGVTTRKTRGLTFWTLSVWEGEAQLRAYLASDPHRAAIPKLFPWCDEAATTHWSVGSPSMPQWVEATAKLLENGRLLRVRFPSEAQKKGVISVT